MSDITNEDITQKQQRVRSNKKRTESTETPITNIEEDEAITAASLTEDNGITVIHF